MTRVRGVIASLNKFKTCAASFTGRGSVTRFTACLLYTSSRGRVVGVINLQHRQHHVYRPREIRLISTIGFLVGAEIEMARLEDANFNLSEQLQTRKVVERAKGILQRDLGLSEEQAYLTLQRQSRQKRKPMKEIAEAIVLSDEVRGNSSAPKPA